MDELKNSKNQNRINLVEVKRELLETEEKTQLTRIEKKFKKLTKCLLSEIQLDFTDLNERRKQEDGIDLGLFFELAEEHEIVFNKIPVNTLIEDLGTLKDGFLRMVFLFLLTKEIMKLTCFEIVAI